MQAAVEPAKWHLQLADLSLERDKLPAYIRLCTGKTTVGRTSANVLIDPTIADAHKAVTLLVSGHHADLEVDAAGKLTLTDCSTNGTMVDGVGLSKGSTVPLEVGSEVVFGTRGVGGGTEINAMRIQHCQQYFKFIVHAGEPPVAAAILQSPLGVVDEASSRVNTAPAIGSTPAGTQVAAASLECSQASLPDFQAAATPLGDPACSASSGAPQCFLSPAAAATRLGYEDCHALGNFRVDESGARTPIQYAAHEALSEELTRRMVPYDSLRAFETADGRGWGACCATAICKGDVVVEAVG